MPKKRDDKPSDVEEVDLDAIKLPEELEEILELPDELHFEEFIGKAAQKAVQTPPLAKPIKDPDF